MSAGGQAVANTLAAVAIALGAAGIIGLVLEFSGRSDRLHRAVRDRLSRATRSRAVDLGDGDDLEARVRDAMDRFNPFCCPLHPHPDCTCVTARRRAELGDHDDPAVHAATPESFRAWLAEHGVKEV